MLRVIHCKVGETPKVVEVEKEYFQSIGTLVNGYIEIIRPMSLPKGLCFVVDEEGYLKNDPKTNEIGSNLYGGQIVGDIVLTKEGFVDGEMDFVTLTDKDIKAYELILGIKISTP